MIGEGVENEPLSQIQQGMRQISNGHLETRLDEWPDEPYRSVFETFNTMADNLLHVEALQEEFVSNVSHEFKTPLAYIQGYATLLQDENLSSEERTTYLEYIIEATQHLSTLIGTLLQLNELNRPASTFETARFSLDEQLRHTMAMFIPHIVGKKLDYDIDLERIDINANEELLANVWLNLLSNAVKYTPSNGKITLAARQQGNMVTVVVSDTGLGMSDEQISHAFDRFYTRKDAESNGGSGLGLPIVKAVVKKHGGTIDIQSEPDKGATFTVTLPVNLA